MKVPFFIRSSLFKKLFVVTFFAAFVPIGLSWIYFFYLSDGTIPGQHSNLLVVYYGLFVLALFSAALGAYSFSKHITRPITHFIKSAIEIAGGNFSHQVKVESSDEIGRLAKIFNYMVEELRRLHDRNLYEIIAWKKIYETILENIADGVILTKQDNKIMFVNRAAEGFFDLAATNVVNQPIGKTLRHPELLEAIQATRNGKQKLDKIEITVESSSRRKPIILEAKPRFIPLEGSDKLEVKEAVATTFTDLTNLKEVDRVKTELVWMVAHELRSPLTCISGFTELLLDPSITREQAEEYASIILKESSRLNDLINKFLDISKIEAGKSHVRKTPVDMKMLVEKVLDFNSQLADKKEIHVHFESPAEVSLLELDRDLIEQAILNLFSNAVKYSPENAQVTVRLREDATVISVDIEDTGYGISEKSIPHIFEKFYRVTDNEDVRDTMGSGLGLPLVKEIVEIHGGKIKVSSVLGKGSIFTIFLPKKTVETAESHIDRVLN
ncbi:MAG: PAS domain-containing sensor histidine kinase [bacterium]